MALYSNMNCGQYIIKTVTNKNKHMDRGTRRKLITKGLNIKWKFQKYFSNEVAHDDLNV